MSGLVSIKGNKARDMDVLINVRGVKIEFLYLGMARNLKRVPLDFSYPLNKIWNGYLNPYQHKCPDCENGLTPARERLQALVRLIMLSGSDSVKGKNHPYFTHIAEFVSGFTDEPSKDMGELTEGLCGRSPDRFIGHDSSDSWVAEKKIIEAAGLDSHIWGFCKTCNGEAVDPAFKERYDAWEKTEPPTGEGFQLWEDVSEGSPQSPVFKTLDELCQWCAVNATTFADFKASKEDWFKMLNDGFVFHKEGTAIFI